MRITDLTPQDESLISEVAAVLMDGFKERSPESWPTIAKAIAEVRESLDPGHISRVAIDDAHRVIGWIGGIPRSSRYAWELHPIVVRPDAQGRGIGRALMADFEQRAFERGGRTVFLGTDDEQGLTSIGGIDLYPDVLSHLQSIRNLRRHTYEFYQKLGYVIVGAIPDASGFGKPDILMAKRLVRAN